MSQRRRGPNTKLLCGMVALALGYGALVRFVPSLTGHERVDGTIGVLLGLYICSHPAANAIDLVFMERTALHHVTSEWEGLGWLGLNLAVMVVGWLVIVSGTTRFVG